MFCQKCGSELPDGATFCAKCGTKQDAVQKTDTTKVIADNIIKNAKKVKPLYYIIGVAIVAVLIIAICIGNVMGKTVNLNNYVSVTFDGYDTRGRAQFDFDKKSFEEKYGDKIKIENAEDSLLLWMTPSEVFFESLSYDLDNTDGLSNGDEVTLSWDINEKELKKAFGLTVKAEDKSFTVADLEEISTFDPFTGVEVSYSGIAPNGSAYLENYPSDNGLYYEIENGYNVSNGDTVAVKVSYGWGSEDSYIEEYGKLPNSMTKDYEVEGLDEYVSTYADIDASLIDKMKIEAEDIISSYVAKSYDDDFILSGLEYAGYIFCGTKPDVDYWSSNNGLYLIYKGEVSNSNEKFDTVDVYFPVKFDDFLKNADGVHYESCYGIAGSSYFSNSWYSTRG